MSLPIAPCRWCKVVHGSLAFGCGCGHVSRILRRKNIIALGNSGAGKTHVALALGLAARQKDFTVALTTIAALVNQLMEARDEKRLLKMQRDLATVKLLIFDELRHVPLSPMRGRTHVRDFFSESVSKLTLIAPVCGS